MKLISTLPLRALIIAIAFVITVVPTAASAAPPPVFWNVFEIKVRDNNTIEMNWLVTEYDNQGFWVEHSTDGINWTEIGQVPSKKSAESLEDYYFTHKNSKQGKHYYRVRTMDIDQYSYGFSKVRAILIKDEPEPDLVITPNPATDHITINNSKGKYSHAEISNLFGKNITMTKIGNQMIRIDISKLPIGTYLLRLHNNDGGFTSGMFIRM
jgi:hypothetical protein